jgi:hypothetical protein
VRVVKVVVDVGPDGAFVMGAILACLEVCSALARLLEEDPRPRVGCHDLIKIMT